jgi:hypothetical protein
MKLLYARFDSRELNKIVKNTIRYSQGFADGIDSEKILFMNKLAEFVVDALYKYIDAQARGNPEALHHVYEWGGVGSPGARLYKLNSKATSTVIHIGGNFLPSSTVSDTATEPFVDKANIMENKIAITVAPNSSNYLVFDVPGRTVFTTNEVYIANPGGDAVAGSFGRTVETFFGSYFVNALLEPFLNDLATAEEYPRYFPEGTRAGYSVGVKAGKEYLSGPGVVIE